MSQRHPIDVFFRRRLAQYDAGAPMHVWDKIQAYQQRRRQLRRLYWLGGSASALALLIFLTYPTNTSLTSPKDVRAAAPNTASLKATTNQATAGATVSPQPARLPKAAASLPLFSPPTAPATGTLTVLPTGGQAESPSLATGLSVAYATDLQSNEDQSVVALTDAGEFVAADEIAATPLHQSATPLIPAAATTDPMPAPVYMATEVDQGSRMTGPHVRAHTQWMAPLPPARQAQSHLSTTPDWHNLKPSTGCAGLQVRRAHWGLEILGGPLTSFDGLSARTQEQENYLSMRRATERNRLSLGTQFRLVYQSSAGLRLRLGAQYLRLNQHFTYENPDIMEIRIVPQLGNNGEIIGSDTIYTPLLHHTNNRYQWVNIPLLLGYEFKSNKLRLGVLAGPVFNLLFDASGEMIAPDSRQPATFGNKGELVAVPAYRTRAGIGWYGGINASVNLYGRYSLFTEASVQHFQHSLTVSDYPLTQRPWIGSLLLGLRTRL